jgi:hypothetical protein
LAKVLQFRITLFWSIQMKGLVFAPLALAVQLTTTPAQTIQAIDRTPKPGADVSLVSGDKGEMATSMPVSLRITLCLWSQERPQALCREVPLTPGGPAGPGFDSKASCEVGKAQALGAWLEEAKQVLGFTTGLAGAGYRINEPRCVTSAISNNKNGELTPHND